MLALFEIANRLIPRFFGIVKVSGHLIEIAQFSLSDASEAVHQP